ncbi:LysR family transcriptional regulator [Vallitalea pronyensis]|uniref:LysR family transcriptional regulator n=1 Tax=Vallitalea pronyensis TaxID=1348613 RepID=A0A8J8MK43_9FIRM|nr:LysR family transcriptional regulator [Vallitalea pronyensis]QUI22882.1 LysR family transcriptional regulator [Vallitalea pronyensis]
MKINFELYKVFYMVAKEGQISAAAKKLYISQPAVSQAIKQLEEKLGANVFIRTPKGIKLTSEGKVLFEYIQKACGLIITGEIKFLEMQNLDAGEVTIGASDTLCSHYLLPYLEQFHQDYPHIKINVTNRTSYEIIQLLKGGHVDFGIVNLPVEEDQQMTITETLELQDCFICGKTYQQELSNGEGISLEKLQRYPLILLEKGSNTRRYVDNFFWEHGQRIEPDIELGSLDLLVKFARIGLGIACVTKNFIKEKLIAKDVFEIKLKKEIPIRHVGVVTLKNTPISSAGKKFLEILC